MLSKAGEKRFRYNIATATFVLSSTTRLTNPPKKQVYVHFMINDGGNGASELWAILEPNETYALRKGTF